MGWLRTILLGDIGNRLDIEDTERNISRLEKKNHDKDALIAVLHEELEQQKLGLQALTRFLLEKELIVEDELSQFIDKVDAEDGRVDGKMKINLPKQQPSNENCSRSQSQIKRGNNYSDKPPYISDVAGTPWENDPGYKGK